VLYMPTRIFLENGALKQAQKHIAALGNKALIVCGKSSAYHSGVMDELLPLLQSAGIAHSVFDSVRENPDLQCIMQGKAQFLTSGSDFIIAIGGGSPIDAAKAISLAAANDLCADQLFDAELRKQSHPIVAIPTTHGTGSEATQYSVLTDVKAQKKAGFGSDLIFPRLAIVDARYMRSLSPRISLNTSIDALSHLLEGIYSVKRNPLLYPMIAQGIDLIIKNLSLCLKEPDYLPAREALARASLFGGITIAHTSTTLQHAIGYPFTTRYGIAHGLANGMFMEQLLRFYAAALESELEQIFGLLNISMEDFLAWLHSFPIQIKVELSDEQIEEWIPVILSTRNTGISPRIPDHQQLRSILQSVQKQQEESK